MKTGGGGKTRKATTARDGSTNEDVVLTGSDPEVRGTLQLVRGSKGVSQSEADTWQGCKSGMRLQQWSVLVMEGIPAIIENQRVLST
ncbi:hypothetical protein Tco_0084617 [Tanacetum coccineum]